MLKKVLDKWKPDTVEIALVYAVALMKHLETKNNDNYNIDALNEMDLLKLEKKMIVGKIIQKATFLKAGVTVPI